MLSIFSCACWPSAFPFGKMSIQVFCPFVNQVVWFFDVKLYELFIFNWRIIALQYCVGFCHTTTWISHKYTYDPSLLNISPTPTPSHPSSCHRAPGWTSCVIEQLPTTIRFTYGNVYASMLLSQFIPPSSSLLCLQVCSLGLCLYSCSANRFISTIVLDSIYTC